MLIAILIMLILLALGGLITAAACVGIYYKTYGIYQVQREMLASQHQVPATRNPRAG
jgi:hypothetical protein